jgi:RNA polymerase sigma factor (sigma-70 family)
MTTFRHQAIHELTNQQVRFAPPARRREQVAKAQRLLAEVESSRAYPYAFVCYRLTDYRSNAYPDLLVTGEDLKHDLALFVIQVERSLPPVPIEQAGEELLTLEEVSKRFNVSTKTIGRWRLRGLVARRVKVNGRSHLGFPVSAVEQFANRHKERVEKSAKFSHLTDAEKDEIILAARRLAVDGTSLTDASRQIAQELGRSAEAVRYTIKNFDRAHPDDAVYPQLTGPLDAAAKEQIYHSFAEGTSMDTMMQRFNRARSSLYRVVNEVRAERLVREPVDYMYNAEFDEASREAEFLGPMPGEAEFLAKVEAMKPPKDVDPQMAYLYEKPLLTREQEAHVFRKMNFLKHKLNKLQEKLDPNRARMQDLQELDNLAIGVKQCRDMLIECNQRLVHSLATKHLQPGQNLDELKSDANLSLMRAVEKFDYSRGNKFSTYATWAIMKNFARSIPDENVRKQRYMTGTDEVFDARADIRTDEHEVLATADAAKARVNRLLDYLDPRTRDVIKMRTGLAGGEEMTLEQIGQYFGITKERVRQINVRGMKQLRERAAQENVELP